MGDTIQIQELQPDTVLRRIDAALGGGGVDVAALADFVALIDWSGKDARTSPAAEIVGRLEALVSEFGDGFIDLPTYVSALGALAYGGKAGEESSFFALPISTRTTTSANSSSQFPFGNRSASPMQVLSLTN